MGHSSSYRVSGGGGTSFWSSKSRALFCAKSSSCLSLVSSFEPAHCRSAFIISGLWFGVHSRIGENLQVPCRDQYRNIFIPTRLYNCQRPAPETQYLGWFSNRLARNSRFEMVTRWSLPPNKHELINPTQDQKLYLPLPTNRQNWANMRQLTPNSAEHMAITALQNLCHEQRIVKQDFTI